MFRAKRLFADGSFCITYEGARSLWAFWERLDAQARACPAPGGLSVDEGTAQCLLTLRVWDQEDPRIPLVPLPILSSGPW